MDVILRLGKFGGIPEEMVKIFLFNCTVKWNTFYVTIAPEEWPQFGKGKAFHWMMSVASIVSFTIKWHFRLIRSFRVALSVLWFPESSLL